MKARTLAATALASGALAVVGCGYSGAPGDMSLDRAEQRYYEEVERPREAEKIRDEQEREAQRERQARREAASTPLDLLAPGTCVDVTSEDWNWDNDVLCMDDDGSTFLTSYEGADAFLSTFAPPPPRPAPEPAGECASDNLFTKWVCEHGTAGDTHD